MDVITEQRNTWISLGVIAGLSVLLTIFRTWKWFGRSGKDVVDLAVRSLVAFVFAPHAFV